MGNFLTGATDTRNNYQAQNPYNTAASMATEQANQKAIFDQQQALAASLKAQADGTGPSASQTMLATAMQNSAANNNAAAVGQRGINPALAMRMAGQNTTNANMQAEAAAVAARQKEQATAQGELGGLYNSMGNQNTAQQGLITGANANANNVNYGVANQNTTQGQEMFSNTTTGGAAQLAKLAGPAMAAYDGGEIPDHVKSMADIYHKDFRSGGKVPGTPKVPGNDPINDTIPAKLSPGEVVIPNDIMQSDDPAGKAAKFVASIVEKKSKDHGDFKEALKRHVAGRKKK